MDLNQTVCNCFGITAADIKKAVENGATTYEEVQEETGVGTACGICEEEVRELVEKFRTQ